MRARLDKAVRMPVMKVLIDFNNTGFGTMDDWVDISEFVHEVSASKQKEGEVLGGVSSDILTLTVDNSTNAFSVDNPNSFFYNRQRSNMRIVVMAGFSGEELVPYMVGYVNSLKPTWKGKTYTLNCSCPMEKLKKAKVPKMSYNNVKWDYLVGELLDKAGIEPFFIREIPVTEYNYPYFKFEEEKCFDALKKLMETVCGVAYFDGNVFRAETKLAIDYEQAEEVKHELLADDFFEFEETIDESGVINEVTINSEPKEICPLEVVAKTPENVTRVDNETTIYEGNGLVYIDRKNLPLYISNEHSEHGVTVENLTRGGVLEWSNYNVEEGYVRLKDSALSNVMKGDTLSLTYDYQLLTLLPNQVREYSLTCEDEVDSFLEPDVVAWNPSVTANIPYSSEPDVAGTISKQYAKLSEDKRTVTIALKNNTNDKLSISTLQFRGYPIRVNNPIEVHAKDTESIEIYDEKETSISNNYINNIRLAEKLAQFIVDNKSDIPKTLSVQISGYAELMLGDLCLVTEEQSYTDHYMEIEQVNFTFNPNNGWLTDLILIERPTDDWVYGGFDGDSIVSKPPVTNVDPYVKSEEPPLDTSKIWIDSDTNKMYVYDSSTNSWIPMVGELPDDGVSEEELNQAIGNINQTIIEVSEGRELKILKGDVFPDTAITGQLFIHTGDNDNMYRWNGNDWVLVGVSQETIDGMNDVIDQTKADLEQAERDIEQVGKDLDAKAGELQGKADNLQEQADELRGMANSLQSDADRLAERTDGLEGSVATINTNINTINGELSVKATKTEVQQAIDNINIGGRNYLFNSEVILLHSNNNNEYPIQCTLIEENGEKFYRTTRISGTNNTKLSLYNNIPVSMFNPALLEGKTVTMSFKARASRDITGTIMCYHYNPITHFLDNNKSVQFTTEWQTYSITIENFPLVIDGIRFSPYSFNIQESDIGTLYVDTKQWKIEIGNKVTDWTPAPEDTQKLITQNTASINANATRIETVYNQLQTEQTAQGNRISSAESKIQQNAQAITSKVTLEEVTNEISKVKIGGRNLFAISGPIYTHSANSYTKDGYKLNIVSNSGGNSGLKLPYAMFEVGKDYVLSFKFKKTGGTLKAIGGHCSHRVKEWFVDGEKMSRTYQTGFLLEDTEDIHSVEVHFNINLETGTDLNVYIQANRQQAFQVSFDLWDIQLEEGNKATQWSPAPEDFQTQIDTHTQRISSAESSITQQAGLIATKVTASEVETISNTITTNAVNNLQIGGRNLIIASKVQEGKWLNTDGSLTNFANGYVTDFIDVKSNQDYVLQLVYVAPTTSRICEYDVNGNLIKQTANTDKYEHYITTSSTTAKVRIGFKTSNGSIEGVKFEIGNKPTAYTPAPEDVEQQITTVTERVTKAESDIVQNANLISQKVSMTEVTNAINNLQIGGRNLLENSSFAENRNKWSATKTGIDSFVVEDGYNCMKVSGAFNETRNISQGFGAKIQGDVINEQEYTVSCWVKMVDFVAGSTNNLCGLYIEGWYDTEYSTNNWFKATSIKGENYFKYYPQNQWVYVEWTFKIPYQYNTARGVTCVIYLRDFTGDAFVRNVKLERGNKATDWTPAPEDTDAKIDAQGQRITTAESTINQYADLIESKVSKETYETDMEGFEQRIEDAESTVTQTANSITSVVQQKVQEEIAIQAGDIKDEILGQVNSDYTEFQSRLSTAESKIDQKADSVTLTATKTELLSNINNIQVGGRNLLLNTGSINGYYGSINHMNPLSSNVVTIDDTFGEVIIRDNGKTSGEEVAYSGMVSLQKGTYTASAWVKANEYTKMPIEIYGIRYDWLKAPNKYWTITPNEWTRIYVTFEVDTDGDEWCVRVDNNATNTEGKTSRLLVCRYQLEKGNKVTDWTPAPEDVENYIDEQITDTKAELKVTTDAISAEVSKNAQSINSVVAETATMKTNITANATAITQRATKTEMTQAISDAVDAIDIGGRNYIAYKAHSLGITGFMDYNTVTTDFATKTITSVNLSGKDYLTIQRYKEDGTIWKPESGVYTVSGYMTIDGAIPETNPFSGHVFSTYGSRIGTNTIKFDTTTGYFECTQNYVNTSGWIFHVRIIPVGVAKTIVLKNLQMEKGNKATDYKDAPEDIESKLVELNASIETTAEQVSIQAERISTTEEQIATNTASIKTNADSILERVTRTEMETEFNNLDIGSRNCILKADFSGNNPTTTGTWTFVDGIATAKQTSFDIAGFSFTLSTSPFFQTKSIGETVTFSMEYKVDEALTFSVTNGQSTGSPWVGMQTHYVSVNGNNQYQNWFGGKDFPIGVTNGWIKKSITFDIPNDAQKVPAILNFYFRNTTGKIHFRNPMLVIGNKAANFQLAPEDMENRLKSVEDAAFTILPNQISSKVSQDTYNTDLQTMNSKIQGVESSITQTATDIAMSVSDTKFNSIVVGGYNLLPNADFSQTVEHITELPEGSDGTGYKVTSEVTSAHANIYPNNWSSYNGGVANATTVSHAHVDSETFGFNTILFDESDGTFHWKGISTALNRKEVDVYEQGKLMAGEYTFSCDIYVDKVGSNVRTWGGFYSYLTDGDTQGFHAGQYLIRPTEANKWQRYSCKTVLHENVDFNRYIAFYIYGHGIGGAKMWIKNVQLEYGNKSTSFDLGIDKDNKISSLESRIQNAEIEIQSDKIISTVLESENFLTVTENFATSEDISDMATKEDVNTAVGGIDHAGKIDERLGEHISNDASILNNYFATKSQIEQTKDDITMSFSQVGGINLVKNSLGYNGVNDGNWQAGSPNLIRNGAEVITNNSYGMKQYDVVKPFESGKYYVAQLDVTPAAGVTHFAMYLSNGYKANAFFETDGTTNRQTIRVVFPAQYYEGRYPSDDINYAKPTIYRFPNDGTVTGDTTIHWLKVERGGNWTEYTNDWDDESRYVVCGYDPDADGLGFESSICLTGKTNQWHRLFQKFQVAVGKQYTLSFYYKIVTGSAEVKITNEDNMDYADTDYLYASGATDGYVFYSTTFTAVGSTAGIKLTASAGAEVYYTGIMVNIGDKPFAHTFARGEVYNTNISFDMNGIQVIQLDSNGNKVGYTMITPQEFAGYYDTDGDGSYEKIFYLNQDAVVSKRSVAEQEIIMGKLKFINLDDDNYTGWALVPSTTNDWQLSQGTES